MKKIKLFFALLVLAMQFTFAQTPNALPYQAVARNSSGNLLVNQIIRVRFSIRDVIPTGTIVYQENQTPTTNNLGLFTVNIGQGIATTGIFASINWGTGVKFTQVELDITGGTSYVDMGTQQMMSVPYALYAANANVPGVAGPQGPQGATGPKGDQGDLGPQGIPGSQGSSGSQGVQGNPGSNGHSAYEVWSGLGNAGSEADFIASLVGPQGSPGQQGLTGTNGINGTNGTNGTNGQGVPVGGTANQVLAKVDGTNYNTRWVTPGSSSPCGHTIGQTYQGGIIFYLDPSGCHGLISAPTNQSGGAAFFIPPPGWNLPIPFVAHGGGLFDGFSNTASIHYAQAGTTNLAATICYNLNFGGYSDWYLPSIYELRLMYQNIGQGNSLGLGNVGGFANDFYWSSTQVREYIAHAIDFAGRLTDTEYGTPEPMFVRAVRAF